MSLRTPNSAMIASVVTVPATSISTGRTDAFGTATRIGLPRRASRRIVSGPVTSTRGCIWNVSPGGSVVLSNVALASTYRPLGSRRVTVPSGSKRS